MFITLLNPSPPSHVHLLSVLDHVKNILPDYKFNSILITKYCDGSEHLGFHSDDEEQIEIQSDIVTISFGESRTVKFRGISESGNLISTEQSLLLDHGNVFIMSRISQNYFQHSVLPDNTLNPRISITLRLLNSKIPVPHPNPRSISPSCIPHPHTDTNNDSEDLTLYIGDSMLKHLNPNRMSSSTQKALTFCYSGATISGVMSKLVSDAQFNNLNPMKVKQIFLLCGTNNVDKVLKIPFCDNSEFVDIGVLNGSDPVLNSVKAELLDLVNFLHNWASSAFVNIINILPRESLSRNSVINHLNQYIKELSVKHEYINMVSTENHRNLFAHKDGNRKFIYFSDFGNDNVHLNNLGISRLAKHLKYVAHNPNIMSMTV